MRSLAVVLCLALACSSSLASPVKIAASSAFWLEEPTAKQAQNTLEPVKEQLATIPLGKTEEAAPAKVEEPVKVAEPAAKVEEPVAKVAEPAAKVEEPVAKVEEPVAKVAEPAAKVEEPAAKVAEPAAKVEEPAAKVAEPAAKVEEPAKVDLEKQTAKDEPKVAAKRQDPIQELMGAFLGDGAKNGELKEVMEDPMVKMMTSALQSGLSGNADGKDPLGDMMSALLAPSKDGKQDPLMSMVQSFLAPPKSKDGKQADPLMNMMQAFLAPPAHSADGKAASPQADPLMGMMQSLLSPSSKDGSDPLMGMMKTLLAPPSGEQGGQDPLMAMAQAFLAPQKGGQSPLLSLLAPSAQGADGKADDPMMALMSSIPKLMAAMSDK